MQRTHLDREKIKILGNLALLRIENRKFRQLEILEN